MSSSALPIVGIRRLPRCFAVPAAPRRCRQCTSWLGNIRRLSNFPHRSRLFGASGAIALALLPLAHGRAAAHEVPASVTVQVLVRQQGDRLQVLVRTPLEAMQEMQFPVDLRGILDLEEVRSSGLLTESAHRWITPNLDLFAGDAKLPAATVRAVQLSIPSDRSFTDFDRALAHIRGPPLAATTQIVWRQALLDVLLETPLDTVNAQEGPRFSIDPRFGRLGLRVLVVIRYESQDGDSRVLQLAAEPGRVRLDPHWGQAGLHFVAMGFEHILERSRPSAVPGLPGGASPPPAATRPRRDVLHGRPLDHPDRLRRGSGAAGIVVSHPGRGPDRPLNRLHGVREHPGSRPASAAGPPPSASASSTASASPSHSANRSSSRARIS